MQQQPILPPRLGPGARIALVAPSGPLLERDDRTRAEALCRALGFEPGLEAAEHTPDGLVAALVG